jgi:hypothetical protein
MAFSQDHMHLQGNKKKCNYFGPFENIVHIIEKQWNFIKLD